MLDLFAEIARLKREGLATSRPYRGVFLTPAGEALGARMKSRHRLVVDLLRAVGVPAEVRVWPGQVHDFQLAASLVPEAIRSLRQIGDYIREATG